LRRPAAGSDPPAAGSPRGVDRQPAGRRPAAGSPRGVDLQPAAIHLQRRSAGGAKYIFKTVNPYSVRVYVDSGDNRKFGF